ncbi:hypothetical protein L1887_50967 [Cichorium endivia]|nr:hypothetical protein L1887_50967 [Cichorium endivia]
MPRILLKERGAFGNADTGGAWLSSARATAGDKPEEGEDDVKSSCPLCPGRHTCYNGRDKGSRSREGELTPKTRPQFGLQAATRLHEAGIASKRQPGELKHLSSQRKRKQKAIPVVAASENGSSLNRENGVVGEQYKRRAARRSSRMLHPRWRKGEMPLEPRASWFSPKCVEAQQLTGHLGVRRGRENASSQCSSTRRYGAEVTHAILPGKARTAFNKRVPVPETDTEGVPPHKGGRSDQARATVYQKHREPATEAPVNGGRNYNGPKVAKFLVGTYGPRTVSGRQFLWGVGLPKGNGGVQRFPRAGRDWPSSAKAEGSLTARPTRRAGTKADLPKSSHRREGLAPRCRLFATWGSSMFQGLGCSPIKAVRELGSERRETVRSISGVGVRALRGPFPSTRGREGRTSGVPVIVPTVNAG